MSAVTLWRICKKKYVSTAFDGEGAQRFPGRWNNRGVPMVYCANTAALALLEILVYLEDIDMLQEEYSLVTAQSSNSVIKPLRTQPEDWNDHPAPISTREIGSRWVEQGESLVLAVPSVILPIETLYLINPQHPQFSELKIDDPQPL